MNYRLTHDILQMEEPDYNFSDGTNGPRDHDDWAEFKDKTLIDNWIAGRVRHEDIADYIGRGNIIGRVEEAVEELD